MDLTDEQVQQEVRWIDAEAGWPRWPLLPVKNIARGEAGYPADEEVGVLTANEEGGERTIYFKNLFDFETGRVGEQLEGVKKRTFENTEALVRAGWIGD